MRINRAKTLKRILVEIGIGIMLIAVALIVRIQIAKAWQGDSSNPHVLMGQQLMQHSLFNRLAR